MRDEEIWDEALHTYWSGPVDRKKNSQNAMACIRELLEKPAAPICRMSLEAILITIRTEVSRCVVLPAKHYRTHNAIMMTAARVARSLAQPLPKIEPDKEAKRLAEAFRSATNSDYPDWDRMDEEERNGWRAVAAAKMMEEKRDE